MPGDPCSLATLHGNQCGHPSAAPTAGLALQRLFDISLRPQEKRSAGDSSVLVRLIMMLVVLTTIYQYRPIDHALTRTYLLISSRSHEQRGNKSNRIITRTQLAAPFHNMNVERLKPTTDVFKAELHSVALNVTKNVHGRCGHTYIS